MVEHEERCAPSGALVIVVRAAGGFDIIAQQSTTAGGAFNFSAIAAGTYSIGVQAGAPLVAQEWRVVEHRQTVIVPDDSTVRTAVGVVLSCYSSSCPASESFAFRVALQYESVEVNVVHLSLLFDLPPAKSPSPPCEVSFRRQQCGDAVWSGNTDAWNCGAPLCTQKALDTLVSGVSCRARISFLTTWWGFPEMQACSYVAQESHDGDDCSACMPEVDPEENVAVGKAEVVQITNWQNWRGFATEAPYTAFAHTQQNLCHGFGLKTDAPGVTVNCQGDCTSGRGYCYATASGACAACVLWDPDAAKGEVLCSVPERAPQGGVLPYTSAWENDATCAASSRVQGWSGSCVSGVNPFHRADASLRGINEKGNQEFVSYPQTGGQPNRTFDYASVACLDAHVSPTIKEGLAWKLFNSADQMAFAYPPNCPTFAAAGLATQPVLPASSC